MSKEKLFKYLRGSESFLKLYSCWGAITDRYPDKNTADAFISDHFSADEISDRKFMKELKRDYIYTLYRYRFTTKEYFYLRLYNYSDKGKHQFVSIKESSALFFDVLCKDLSLTKNKYKTYEKYGQFYGREMIHIGNQSDLNKFTEFCGKHRKVVVKPVCGSFGNGVHLFEPSGENEIAGEFNMILKKGGGVVEELVVQSEEMAKWNPDTVNTVRVVTYHQNGQTVILQTALRMGVKGFFVDNCNAGGIAAVVDPETGIISTPGFKLDHRFQYLFHPDSGVQIVANTVPRWDELMRTVMRIVEFNPQQQVFGWDFCLTDEGWVLIEANSAPGIQDLTMDGARPIMDRLMKIMEEK